MHIQVCDRCRNEQIVLTEGRVSLNFKPGSAYSIDALCQSCMDALASEVSVLFDFAQSNQVVDKEVPAFPCPNCAKTFASAQAMGAHRFQAHERHRMADVS